MIINFLEKVCTYLPRQINQRLINQQGLFTYHPKPNETLIAENVNGNRMIILIPKMQIKQPKNSTLFAP